MPAPRDVHRIPMAEAIRPDGSMRAAVLASPDAAARDRAKSSRAVAMTILGSREEMATSTSERRESSRWWKLTPPSNVRNSPPVALATMSRFASVWATAIGTARPPCGTRGGLIDTWLAQVQPDQESVSRRDAIVWRSGRDEMACSSLSIVRSRDPVGIAK